MSNGDSGAEFVKEPVDYNALIEYARTVEFGTTEPDGTNFTVNLHQIKLTNPQRDAIKNDIITAIITRIGRTPTPPEGIDVDDGIWKQYGRYKN
jgi:hypothetical protein